VQTETSVISLTVTNSCRLSAVKVGLLPQVHLLLLLLISRGTAPEQPAKTAKRILTNLICYKIREF